MNLDPDVSDSSEIIALLLIIYSLLGEDLTEFHVETSIKEELTRIIRSSGNVSWWWWFDDFY